MNGSAPAIDPSRCPLCGGSNGCAMEAERAGTPAVGPCWCTQAQFSPALRARVAAPARGKACICPACAGASHGLATPRQASLPDGTSKF